MKKILKITGLVLLILLAVIAITVGAFCIHSAAYKIPEQEPTILNETGLVQAHGRSLYDARGNALQLRGVNAGQILIQEGWMSPFALQPLKNEDGSYVKDRDGNLQYPEFTEQELRAGIKSNPNLNSYDTDELLRLYWDSCFTEEDFRIIKEELGLNTIRLPIFYLNLLNEDLSAKSEEDAFSYIDWFISQAAGHGLYVVLDLHGAPGSQNGYEHSGFAKREANLWTSPENIQATVDIWDMISRHYTHTRPDLGKWIATYDLLNEPTYRYKSTTTKECWAVFDLLYDTIRANGDAHVITMEGCWSFAALPDPARYGWTNVQYEYHWYNWTPDLLPYTLQYAYYDMTNIGRDHDVPVFIGEFNLFEDKNAWHRQLDLFDERNYSWTVWNYKTTVTGWWTSSWGVYTCQLNCDTEREETKCDVSTCTLEEYLAVCEKVKTQHCATGTLYEILLERKSPSAD